MVFVDLSCFEKDISGEVFRSQKLTLSCHLHTVGYFSDTM